MATTRKARPATGRRVSLVFGSKKAKKAGKTVTVQLIAKVPESTIKALDIKLKPAVEKKVTPKLVKSKNGSLYLPRTSGTNSGKRSISATADGINWYSIVVPTGCSYSLAATVLAKNSKIVAFKTPKGTSYATGDQSKLKSKPTAKKSPTTKK